MATTTKKTTTTDTTGFEALTNFDSETYKQGYEKFAEGVSSFADFNKGSFDAVIASATAFAKGFEKAAKEQSEFFKTAYDEGVATAKAASASKSVQEAVELNSEFVRGSFEKNLGQINKMADLWVETVKQSTEPLTSRYSEVVEKVQSYRP